MSKIKLISAVALVAFALCLSACGESKDTKATPSQLGTEQASVQAAETSPAAESSAPVEDASESSGSKTVQQATVSDKADGEEHGAASEETAAPKSAVTATEKKTSDTVSGSQTGLNDDVRSTEDPEPIVVIPTEAAQGDAEDRDNAEVDFNDL